MSSQPVPFLQEEPQLIHTTPSVPTYRVKQSEPVSSGPFHFYSPGERVAVHDDHLGFPYFEAGMITSMEDQKFWAPAEYLDQSEEQRWRVNPNTGKDEDEERSYKVPASANRISTILKYGPGVRGFPPGESNHGLIEVEAFAKYEPKKIGVAQFNRKIYPVMFEYKRVPEALQKRVDEIGGLELRKEYVLTAREFFSSQTFLSQANTELQDIYLQGIWEVLEGIEQYRYFADAYLDSSDKAVQQGDKKGYDDRDYCMMWLLNRQGVDSALTRALAAGQGGGLTPEAITALVQSLQGPQVAATPAPEFIASIVAATVQAIQGMNKPDVEEAKELKTITEPERVNDAEEFDNVTGGKSKGKK